MSVRTRSPAPANSTKDSAISRPTSAVRTRRADEPPLCERAHEHTRLKARGSDRPAELRGLNAAQHERGHTNSGERTGERQNRSFRQHLRHEAAATGTDVRADSELSLTRPGANEEKVGDVRTGDEQH